MINLENVCRGVLAASQDALNRQSSNIFDKVEYKSKVDAVTEGDKSVSDAIIQYLKSIEFPCVLFDEEAGRINISANPRYTVVTDPIDGTMNFWRGKGKFLPFSTVIGIFDGIGEELKYKDVVAAGLYEHMGRNMWLCEKGKGCYCNGKKVSTPGQTKLERLSCVLIDWGPTPFILSENKIPNLRKFYNNIIDSAWITNISGAAAHLALVANGTNDAHICHGQKPDEMSAGYLMIKESGGDAIDFNGNSWGDRLFRFGTDHTAIAAATPELAKEILKLKIN